jgi:hypothetical protein
MSPFGDILSLGVQQRMALYHTLLSDPDQSALIGAWEWDIVTNTVIWSQNTYVILAISPDIQEIPPDLVLQHVHPEDKERVAAQFQAALEKAEAPTIEYRVLVKGKVKYIRARGRALRDAGGQVRKLIGTVADITHRRVAQPAWMQELELIEPSHGNGGLLVVKQTRVQLSLLQLSLLQVLLCRHQDDHALAEETRGFVTSAELLATLPWETPHPSAANLKQNIRRTRALLKGTGLRIEAARGMGYRLQSLDQDRR